MPLPLLSLCFLTLASAAEPPARLISKQLPPLPPGRGVDIQPGLAGAFIGGNDHSIVVAGGANFPEGMPWETDANGFAPPKVYHTDIFALNLDPASKTGGWFVTPEAVLPHPLAYGAAVSRGLDLICIGGEWKDPPIDGVQQLHLSRDVFAIKNAGGYASIDPNYPPLPEPATMLCAAIIDDVIYVAGGDSGNGPTKNFWSLDLAEREDKDGNPNAEWNWESLPPWPGPARVLALAAAQDDGASKKFYLFSGRNPRADGVDLLTDAYRFDPATRSWERIADVPKCIMAGTATDSGVHHILTIGGADGVLFRKLDQEIPDAIADAEARGDTATAERLAQEKLDILNHHPGFSKDVYAYHTVTDSWTKIGELEGESPVTTGITKVHDGGWVIPTGEISPGVRTTQMLHLSLERTPKFGALNYTILGLYLGGVLLNGLYFSRKMKSTDDFFKAGSRIPWWAAGISIFGTQLSAITFIAIPAKVFATDWRLFVGQMTIIMVAPFIIHLFLPFYRRLNVTTAYEYLEKRFNVFVRCFGSIMFMLLQFARIGIVLYLPSIALSIVTGMSVDVCILLMGTLCILYTVSGGMEAVIWTDVTQVIILAGGALLCLILIPLQIPGGWNTMVELADTGEKFRLLDFRWAPGTTAFLIVLLGSLSANLISYGTDQAVIQRYLTTPDEKSSARSIWTNAVLTIPASFLFFGIGSALYAFYKTHPASLDPGLERTEALFPLFIVQHLPAGIAGLLIAGVFAASMSSLDSAMNSVSAAFTTDFMRRFRPGAKESSYLRIARATTVVIGLLGIGFALLMAHSGIKSLWDQFAFFLGLFGGGLAGVFLLAIFTRRTHGRGAGLGLIGSGVTQYLLMTFTGMNAWFFAFTGLFSCLLIGYVASLLLPGTKKDDTGLTIYTLEKSS